MARPQRKRKICNMPLFCQFVPQNATCETITLTLDEYEVLRLIDLEKLSHEQASKQLVVSRTTVTEIYESARHKVADAVVNGKGLDISGGNFHVCDGNPKYGCTRNCPKRLHYLQKLAQTTQN